VSNDLADGPGGDVARDGVAIGRVPLLEEVEAFVLGDGGGVARVAGLFGDPDATALAAAGFGHQAVLVVPGHAGGVELDELPVGELGPLLIHA
jgi:hypothetical protein